MRGYSLESKEGSTTSNIGVPGKGSAYYIIDLAKMWTNEYR